MLRMILTPQIYRDGKYLKSLTSCLAPETVAILISQHCSQRLPQNVCLYCQQVRNFLLSSNSHQVLPPASHFLNKVARKFQRQPKRSRVRRGGLLLFHRSWVSSHELAQTRQSSSLSQLSSAQQLKENFLARIWRQHILLLSRSHSPFHQQAKPIRSPLTTILQRQRRSLSSNRVKTPPPCLL
jgi:hypothetical protein